MSKPVLATSISENNAVSESMSFELSMSSVRVNTSVFLV
jgi:hypothetical protein